MGVNNNCAALDLASTLACFPVKSSALLTLDVKQYIMIVTNFQYAYGGMDALLLCVYKLPHN